MRLLTLTIAALCLGLLAVAGNRPGPGGGARALAADGKATAAPPPSPISPQEWVEIDKWMQQVRPAQQRVFNAMPDNAQKENIKQLIAEKYRQIKRINNPALREAVIAETRAQDQLFAAQIKYHAARRNHGPRVEEARAEVQAAVANIFDARVAEKKARLERLQSEVDLLQKDVDRMQKDKATTVATWTSRITNQSRPSPAESIHAAPPPDTSPDDSDSTKSR